MAVAAYNNLDFSTAIEQTLRISGRANQYLEEQAPWTLLKKVPSHACHTGVPVFACAFL